MEGFSLSEVFHFLEGSRVQGSSPEFPLMGTWGTHLPGIWGSESCLEAGKIIPGYFSKTVCPLFLGFVIEVGEKPVHSSQPGLLILSRLPLGRTLFRGSSISQEMIRLELRRVIHARFEEYREIQLLSILLSLYSGSHKMKSEPGFASGSSSIGIRVRSQRKIGDEVCELMNSSGSSLGLSAEIEEIKNAAMGETSPLPEGGGSSPVGPISGIGVEEVAFWRQKLHLSENLVIRIPGFRDQVPSLIAEVSRAVNISPGQLNSPVWRILIAMQNLGDLEGLVVWVAVGTEICTVDLRLNKETRKTLISQRSRISANTTRQAIKTQE
ncbi:hypothetical protein DY000_02022285 [Brassica cretica]|uniref:DUF4283 domain-containing protein n=1 Tax=Brassica cretica TaxID=69181 RepID=A0ABQ7EHT7_BRACR|nr:hypothetical protein DY000_02022285 [Brassica cretica]